MTIRKNYFRTLFFSIAVFTHMLMQGCTAFNTFPQSARAGDTVALAIGSGDGLTRSNSSAVFYLDSDTAKQNPVDLTAGIRGIFRLYADKVSSVYNPGSDTKQIVQTSGHEPWVTIMAVDLPPGMPVGPGAVEITTTGSYPTIGNHINNVPVALEILPGTGSPSDFLYEFGLGASQTGDLTLLEALPHAQVIPTFPHGTTWPSYGAMEIKLEVPTSLGTALDPPWLRVLADDMSVSTSSGLSMTFRHNSAEELTVLLMSPFGKLQYFESRFSIVLLSNEFAPVSFTGTPVVTSARYFDIDGNEVVGPQVTDFLVELR